MNCSAPRSPRRADTTAAPGLRKNAPSRQAEAAPGPATLRHLQPHGGLTWEVDEFLGDNAGLVVAEVELSHEDQPFARPPWLAEEVTDDPRYYNANLAAHPFCRWSR